MRGTPLPSAVRTGGRKAHHPSGTIHRAIRFLIRPAGHPRGSPGRATTPRDRSSDAGTASADSRWIAGPLNGGPGGPDATTHPIPWRACVATGIRLSTHSAGMTVLRRLACRRRADDRLMLPPVAARSVLARLVRCGVRLSAEAAAAVSRCHWVEGANPRCRPIVAHAHLALGVGGGGFDAVVPTATSELVAG